MGKIEYFSKVLDQIGDAEKDKLLKSAHELLKALKAVKDLPKPTNKRNQPKKIGSV